VAAAVDTVEAEVRELVRRRGLDPVQDRLAVRRLVDDVVAEYDERTLTSSLPPLSDPFVAARSVYDAVAGFGPLQRHLDDPTVEEVWINEPGRVFVARRGRSELTTTILTAAQVSDLVEKMLKSTGRRVDLSTPFVDAMLPDGSRLHVVIPDITRRHMSVNIRKFVLSAVSMDELVELGTVTSRAARFLEAAVVAGLNVIVAGGTQAGKTTSPTSRGVARSGCDGWSSRPCGCARTASWSARSARRSARDGVLTNRVRERVLTETALYAYVRAGTTAQDGHPHVQEPQHLASFGWAHGLESCVGCVGKFPQAAHSLRLPITLLPP